MVIVGYALPEVPCHLRMKIIDSFCIATYAQRHGAVHVPQNKVTHVLRLLAKTAYQLSDKEPLLRCGQNGGTKQLWAGC